MAEERSALSNEQTMIKNERSEYLIMKEAIIISFTIFLINIQYDIMYWTEL
jgi:hypothetical protein